MKKNYGGFDVSSWELRNLRSHCEAVKKIVRCKTKTNDFSLKRSQDFIA